MAFSVISAISAKNNFISAVHNITITADIPIGTIVFFSSTTDNVQTTNGNSTLHSVSDTRGNTWRKVFEVTDTAGAIADGSTTSLYVTKVVSSILNGDIITLTTSSAVVDSVVSVVTATVDTSKNVEWFTGYTNSTTGTSLSHTLSGLASRGYLFFGLFGAEGEDTAKTPIANYTEWVDNTSATAGAADTNVQQHVQTRILTATGDTVTSSAVTFTNGVQSLTAFYEVDESLSVNINVAKLSSTTSLSEPSVISVQNISITVNTLLSIISLKEPTVTISSVTNVEVTVNKLTNNTAISEPTVSGTSNITVSKLSSTTAISEPTVTGSSNITVSKLSSTTAISEPTVSGSSNIIVSKLSSTTAISEPTVTGSSNIIVSKLSSTTTIKNFVVNTGSTISVDVLISKLSNTTTLSEPTVTGSSNITVSKLSSTTAISEPTVSTSSVASVIVLTTKLSSTTTLSEPIVSGASNITVTKLSSTTAISEPTISGTSSIVVTKLSNKTSLFIPTILAVVNIAVPVNKISNTTNIHTPTVDFDPNSIYFNTSRLQKTISYTSLLTPTFSTNSRLQDTYKKLSIPDEL